LNITVGSGTISLGISSRNSRVAALQKRWDRLRAGLDLILQQRGADRADLPGGATVLLARGYKGSASGVSATISVVLVATSTLCSINLGRCAVLNRPKER